jgi:hypothetical protein
VTWLPDRGILLTVLSSSGLWSGAMPQVEWSQSSRPAQPVPPAWVSVLTIHDDAVTNRLVPVATTADAHQIRTLPLSDGRVVLVAGDSVSFLTF